MLASLVRVAVAVHRGKRGSSDRPAIHAEVLAQRSARIAAAEAVGAKSHVSPRHPGTDEVGDGAHVIARCDDRAGCGRKGTLDPGAPALAVGSPAVAPQLGPARHAPDVG